MVMRVLCVIILIALSAVSNVRAQDIEVQHLPSTTEGPLTTAQASENIPTTTEDVEQSSTSTELEITTEAKKPTADVTTENVEKSSTATEHVLQTEPNPRTPVTEISDTTAEAKETTTDVATTVVAKDTTSTVPTIATIPKVLTTPKPDRRRKEGRLPSVCRFVLQNGKPYYNWIFRVVMVPKVCSYCCRFYYEELEKCHEISPIFCS